MTIRTGAELKALFQGLDPQDWVSDLVDSIPSLLVGLVVKSLKVAVTYASNTGTIGTIPANSVILSRYAIRSIAWDALTNFQLGKSGSPEWLMTMAQANWTGIAPDVEVVANPVYVDVATSIIATWDQGAATTGNGYIVVEYVELA